MCLTKCNSVLSVWRVKDIDRVEADWEIGWHHLVKELVSHAKDNEIFLTIFESTFLGR